MHLNLYNPLEYHILNERVLHLSPNLVELIKNIQHPISQDILSLNKRDISTFYNYLDLHEEDQNMLTAVNDRDEDMLKKLNMNPWIVKRNKVRLGKIVYNLLKNNGFNYKENEIEKYVHLLRAEKIKRTSSNYSFKFLSGQDILTGYLCNNYHKSLKGTLWNSCMKSEDAQKYLQLYVENPNQVKLLVLQKNDQPEIWGRALVWTGVINQFKKITLMDVIYWILPEDELLFQQYAKENNMYYKTSTKVTNGIENLFGEFKIKLDKVEFEQYPYIDFLHFLTIENKTLSNIYGQYRLDSNRGSLGKCEVCQDDKELLCPKCGGTSTMQDRYNRTVSCDRCQGYGFVDCPNCSK